MDNLVQTLFYYAPLMLSPSATTDRRTEKTNLAKRNKNQLLVKPKLKSKNSMREACVAFEKKA